MPTVNLSRKRQRQLQVHAFRLFCLLVQLYVIHSILNNTLYSDANISTIRHILLGRNMYEYGTDLVTNNPVTRFFGGNTDKALYNSTHTVSSVRFCLTLVHLLASLAVPYLLHRNARPYYTFNKKWVVFAIFAKPLYTVLEYTIPSMSVLRLVLPSKVAMVITAIQTVYLTFGGQLMAMVGLIWYFSQTTVNKYAPYVPLTLGQQCIGAGYSLYYSLSIYIPNLLINSVSDKVITLLINKSDIMTSMLIVSVAVTIAVVQHIIFVTPVNNILKRYRKQIDFSDTVTASIIKQDDDTVIMQIPLTLFDTDLTKYAEKQTVKMSREAAEKLFHQIKPQVQPSMIENIQTNIKHRLRSKTKTRQLVVNDGRHEALVTPGPVVVPAEEVVE